MRVLDDRALKEQYIGILGCRCPVPMLLIYANEASVGACQQMELRSHMSVALGINGRSHEVVADSRSTLLDLLREHLDLTGAKKGCSFGECGACTVHLSAISARCSGSSWDRRNCSSQLSGYGGRSSG